MSDTAPALKTMFRLIKRKFLKEILAIDGQPMRVNWNLGAEQLETELYRKFAELHHSDQRRFAHICTILFDINAVCQDNRRGRFVSDCIRNAGRMADALAEIRDIKPSIHLWVSWVFLRMPDLWETLKRTAHVKQVIGLGGQKKYIKKPPSDEPTNLQCSAFESEFLSYMEREKTMITCLHIDREDLGSYVRYVLHVNPFPKEVEQFDADGNFKLQLDKNAEGFTIVHHKGETGEAFLRIKCAFNSAQKKRILELFATFMLATEICEKPKEEYPIREFNPGYQRGFSMKVPNSLVKEARVHSVVLEIVNPIDGFVDELTHKCESGDLFERLEHSCKDFPIEWRRPIAWEFDITIFLDRTDIIQPTFSGKDEIVHAPKTRKYRVRVTETNVTIPNCQDDAHKQLILDTLAANGIRNVFKKEILAREYRK